MFPKKVIGRYTGSDINGVFVGKIQFLPNHSIECHVNLEMYEQIAELCKQGVFHLFEFASVNMVDDVTNAIESVSGAVVALSDYVTDLGNEVDCKFDDVDYDREESELQFYSQGEMIRTVTLPIPELQIPREIELSKNDTHLLWRVKPISYEIIEWEELIALSEITGPTYDDTELRDKLTELEQKIKILEGGI